MTNLIEVPQEEACFTIDELLSRAESAAWIARLEARGFAPTGQAYPPSYRDNDRLVLDDAGLAAALFERLRPGLPARIERQGATWRLVGLNTRFRACRYRDGQRFALHRDGPHARSPAVRSWLTVMLYLNDAHQFVGGATRFFPRGAPPFEVLPRAGTAIVFDHALWHEGAPVTSGTKWVLRTDVMFEREAAAPRAERDGVEVFAGHTGYVWQVAALPDGTLLSGSRDGTVLRWRDGAAERLVRQPGSVTALLAHPSGAVWTGARDGTLRLARGPRVDEHRDGEAALLSFALLPDERVAVGRADGRIALHTPDGRAAHLLEGHAGWVWSLAVQGARLCSGSEDGTVRAWDPDSGTHELLALEPAPVRALAALPHGLAWGSASGAIRVRDRGGRTRDVGRHAGAVRALLALPDGRLASAGEDGRARVWDLAHGELRVSRGEDETRSPSATIPAAGTGSQSLARVSSSPLELEHPDFVTALALLSDGRLATGCYDGLVRVWSRSGTIRR